MQSPDAGQVIERLVQQAQLLASLHWLASVQVLACIPQQHSVPVQDVAAISGVPADQLLRTIRLTSTAGFLHEPHPGLIEHTPLSTQLLRMPFLADALAFSCNTAVPAAMQMAKVTALHLRTPEDDLRSIYSHVNQSSRTLAEDCQDQTKLKRQVVAYERLRSRNMDEGATEILSRLDWAALGDALVVQVTESRSASFSLVSALAVRYSELRFNVQAVGDDCQNGIGKGCTEMLSQLPRHVANRVTAQMRERGSPQPIRDAAVYILHLNAMCLSLPHEAILQAMRSEIKLHFDILRSNRGASLIIVAQTMPEPGAIDQQAETAARAEDLLMMQMNDRAILDVASLRAMVEQVSTDITRLKIVNQLYSPKLPVVALQARLEDKSADLTQHDWTSLSSLAIPNALEQFIDWNYSRGEDPAAPQEMLAQASAPPTSVPAQTRH